MMSRIYDVTCKNRDSNESEIINILCSLYKTLQFLNLVLSLQYLIYQRSYIVHQKPGNPTPYNLVHILVYDWLPIFIITMMMLLWKDWSPYQWTIKGYYLERFALYKKRTPWLGTGTEISTNKHIQSRLSCDLYQCIKNKLIQKES